MHRISYGGWGRAEPALGYCLSWLPPLVLSPLAVRLNDRFGPQVLVPVGDCSCPPAPRSPGAPRRFSQMQVQAGTAAREFLERAARLQLRATGRTFLDRPWGEPIPA